jgi:hypothetical protein
MYYMKLNEPGCHIVSSHTLQPPSLLRLSNCRYFQTPMELDKVLSDAAEAFSGAHTVMVVHFKCYTI